MVGRERQQDVLQNAFATVVDGRSCHLFTILGAAGVGKSRLAEEFLRTLDGATVVRGRCLSYGEGITYWPVTEVLKQLAAATPSRREPALASILGDDSAASSPTEIAWAFRKLLESRAAERPLVVVFDDVHWGEPAFLDLVEHVADLSRDAPILLLCMARPELLDLRPTWGGGKLNATNVLLEPLGAGGGGAADRGARRAHRPRAARADPRGRRRQPALRRGDGRDGRGGRRDRRAADDPGAARRAARPARAGRARRARARRGRGPRLPPRRGRRARAGGADGRRPPDHARPEGPRAPRADGVRRRRGLSLPAPADPRHRLRGAAEGRPGRAPRALRRPGSRSTAPISSSWTRSSATTSSRRIATARSSGRSTMRRARSPSGQPPAWREAPNAPRSAATSHATKSLRGRALELLPHEHPSRGWRSSSWQSRWSSLVSSRARRHTATRPPPRRGRRKTKRLLARCELARIEAEIQADPSATMQAAIASAREQLAVLERLGDEEGAVWALRQLAAFTAWLGKTEEALRLNEQALERAERVSPRLVNDDPDLDALADLVGSTPVEEGIRRCDEVIASSTSKRLEASRAHHPRRRRWRLRGSSRKDAPRWRRAASCCAISTT